METRNDTKTILFSILIAFLLGAITVTFADPYLPASISNAKKGYQSGFDAAKMLVLNSGVGASFQTPADTHSLSGTITAIDGNQFTLHVQSPNPFDDPSLTDRVVTFSTSTMVIKLVQKDPKVFQSEMDAFAKATQVSSTTSPTPFTQVAANISDMKAGDVVTVTSSQNIKTLKEFSASQIQI